MLEEIAEAYGAFTCFTVTGTHISAGTMHLNALRDGGASHILPNPLQC